MSVYESPIEKLLGETLVQHVSNFAESVAFTLSEKESIVLIPQQQIGAYRVDFAVLYHRIGHDTFKVVIECDGHDFHERTKDQARADKKRDRDLQGEGWVVLRFTGSEITADSGESVLQIMQVIVQRAKKFADAEAA